MAFSLPNLLPLKSLSVIMVDYIWVLFLSECKKWFVTCTSWIDQHTAQQVQRAQCRSEKVDLHSQNVSWSQQLNILGSSVQISEHN